MSLDPRDVAAIVPCHGDPPQAGLLTAVRGHVGQVLVVDDGVSESGRSSLAAATAAVAGVSVLRRGGRPGKGRAVADGLAWLLGQPAPPLAVMVVDADGQHPPDAIPAFLHAGDVRELVIGDRSGDLAAMPRVRRVANRFSNRLLTLRTGRPVPDGQCGMRLLGGRALHEVPPRAGGYEAETEHLRRCLAAGVGVAWVPIPAIYGAEHSSFGPIRDGLRVLLAAVRPLDRYEPTSMTGSPARSRPWPVTDA